MAHSDALSITQGTLFFGGYFRTHHNGLTFARKLGATGRYNLYLSTANIIFYDGTVTSSLATDISGSTSVAVSFGVGTKPEFYLDGASIGVGSTNQTVPATNQDLNFLGYGGSTAGADSPVSVVLFFDQPFTSTEIAALHEWSQSRFTVHKCWPGGGLDIPTLSGAAREPRYLDTIQADRVSLVTHTSGKVSNSNYHIQSGQWRISEHADTGERYFDCIASGIIWRDNVEAYGSWEFEVYKSADANQMNMAFCTADATAPLTNDNRIQINNNEAVRLITNNTVRAATANGYVEIGVRYTIRVTRSAANEFTMYIRGGHFGDNFVLVDVTGGSGTNPIVDAVVTTSQYWAADIDTGDRIYFDRQYAGVIT
jgi:hypothetical protein